MKPAKPASELAGPRNGVVRWSQQAPTELVERIEREAAEDRRSRNGEVLALIEEALSARDRRKKARQRVGSDV